MAACSPAMHEPTFRAAMADAGLNRYLLEMVNIREQSAWVHPHEKKRATEKTKDLVRMAVAKAVLLEPLEELRIGMQPAVLGGGRGCRRSQSFTRPSSKRIQSPPYRETANHRRQGDGLGTIGQQRHEWLRASETHSRSSRITR